MNMMISAASALSTINRALSTTSHNIANASTPGYTRQDTVLSTNTPDHIGKGIHVGRGVHVADIRRVENEYTTKQLNDATSTYQEKTKAYDEAQEIENIFQAEDLDQSGQRMFDAIQDVANDPQDIESRQVLLSEMNILSTKYNTVNDNLTQKKLNNNKELSMLADRINGLGKAIAELNVFEPSNDVLDKRHQLIKELSEVVDVSVVKDGDFDSVFFGTGQSLVLGKQVSEISSENGVVYHSGNDITRFVSGGQMGAVIDVNANVIKPVQESLQTMMGDYVTQMNGQSALGFDLNGAPGQPIFDMSTSNRMSVLLSDPKQIAASGNGDVGNNMNAESMSALSFQDDLRSITTSIASKSRQYSVSMDSAKISLNYIQDIRDSQSGVNLDEEATNLLKLQRAYSANAKVLSVGSQVFDTLLAAVK